MNKAQLVKIIGFMCGRRSITDLTLSSIYYTIELCLAQNLKDLVYLLITAIGSAEEFPSFMPLPPGLVSRIQEIFVIPPGITRDLMPIDGVYSISFMSERRYTTKTPGEETEEEIVIKKWNVEAFYVYIRYLDNQNNENEIGIWIVNTDTPASVPVTAVVSSKTALEEAKKIIERMKRGENVLVAKVAEQLGVKPSSEARDELDVMAEAVEIARRSSISDEEFRQRAEEIIRRIRSMGYDMTISKKGSSQTSEPSPPPPTQPRFRRRRFSGEENEGL
jgi:hypothetical protein